MTMLGDALDFRSLWPVLSILERLFLLVLLATTIYCLGSAVVTLARLRSLGTRENNKEGAQPIVVTLSARSRNVSQAIGATLYLFGFILFVSLQGVRALDGGKLAAERTILGGFILQFAFAANVLFILFVLYLVQWFVSGRVRSFVISSDRTLPDV
jgi:hypothetical protein